MSQVLDYSAGFPGAQAIKQAGYVGAVRYIGFPDRRKCTNRGELVDFNQHEVGMALVFERDASSWTAGFNGGQHDGRQARDHANKIGWPADRPIYMAIDQDVVRSGEFATMVEYLRGAGTTLGGVGATGVYGEADVVDRARDAGVASYFWQTAAWSRGRRTSAHLFQHVGAVSVGGIVCDVNDVLAPDWGQHNYKFYKGGDVSKQDVVDALTGDKYANLGNRNAIDALGELLNRVLVLTDNTMPAINRALAGVAVNVHALTEKPTAEVGPEDIAAITGQLQEIIDHALDGAFEVNITRRQETTP